MASELAEQLLEARSAQNPVLLAYAQLARGVTSFWMGKFLTAREYLESAITLDDPERHRPLIYRYGYDAGVASLAYAAWTLWLLGYSDQALKRSHEALALAQGLSHPLNLAHAELFLGVLRQYRREVSAAQENAESVIAHSITHGLTDYWGWATGLRGWAVAQMGRSEEGIAQQREGLAAFRATEVLLRPYFLCLLAKTWRAEGRLDDGLNALMEALADADEHDLRFYELRRIGSKASCCRSRAIPMPGSFQSCFERAIEIARTQSAKSLELRATMSLARLLRNTDRRGDARAMLAEICGWFTEGLDTSTLREANALLDELNRPSSARPGQTKP